jgi:quercetin dioxygenase-like cupin family protein
VDDESHFRDAAVALSEGEFAPPAPPLYTSEPASAQQVLFFYAPAGWFGDWHPTPARQYFVALSGELEVCVSDGEVRRVRGGDVVYLEDLTGRGHTTRVLGVEPARAVIVQLPE